MWIGDTIYLQLGPHRHAQPLCLRLGQRRHGPAHEEHRLGRALAQRRRRRADRLRAGRRAATSSTPAGRLAASLDQRTRPTAVDSRPSQVSAAEQIEDVALSPKGERALFVARGDVFTVPDREGGDPQPHPHLGRARQVGPLVARRPEDRLHLRWHRRGGALRRRCPGRPGQPEQLTSGGKAMRYAPNGRRTASASPSPTRTAGSTCCHPGRQEARRGGAQCPGPESATTPGRPAAASWPSRMIEPDQLPLDLDLERGGRQAPPGHRRAVPRASPRPGIRRASTSTTWRPLLSRRSSTAFDFNFALDRDIGLYALALRKDVGQPLPARRGRGDGRGGDKDEKPADPRTPRGTTSDAQGSGGQGGRSRLQATRRRRQEGQAEGRQDRLRRIVGLAGVARVPVPFDNYDGLSSRRRPAAVVTRFGRTYLAATPTSQPAIRVFTLKDRKATTLAEGIDGYVLSANGEKLLVGPGRPVQRLRRQRRVARTRRRPIDTAGLVVDRVPAEEWAEVFREAWRRYRDYFYVANMHGYDWDAIAPAVRALLAYVAHRSDLNYVIGEMIAELNVSHAYVAGGDFKLPPRPQVALPGARFELDAAGAAATDRQDLRRPERGGDLPLAADRGRSRRPGGRLRAGDRRRGADGERQSLPSAAPQGQPAGAR